MGHTPGAAAPRVAAAASVRKAQSNERQLFAIGLHVPICTPAASMDTGARSILAIRARARAMRSKPCRSYVAHSGMAEGAGPEAAPGEGGTRRRGEGGENASQLRMVSSTNAALEQPYSLRR